MSTGFKAGTCVCCLQPTDSAIAFVGEAEFVIAAGMRLGLTMGIASDMLRQVTGCDDGMVPAGDVHIMYQVCESCAVSHGFTRPGCMHLEVPLYRQKQEAKQ